MKLIATTTGSYPPIPNGSKEMSIRRAIQDQIEAGMDLLVDGDFRSNIDDVFSSISRGIQSQLGDYIIIDKVNLPNRPLTVDDYLFAKK